ncbi:MAG: SIS domain-containing protein [Chitinophagales bacterium]|nr:SIS domain-containing protein [Chitinophagales bacterium]
MDIQQDIIERIKQSIDIQSKIRQSSEITNTIESIIQRCVACFQSGGKVFFCGNGGSAADSQHLSSELSGRFYFNRPPLNAEALHVNSSYLTATANDFSFAQIFARAIEAKGNRGDILFALTTSGKSENIILALKKAKELGIITVLFTGANPFVDAESIDHIISIPSNDTPRIQECHLLLGHIICEQVEKRMFPNVQGGSC